MLNGKYLSHAFAQNYCWLKYALHSVVRNEPNRNKNAKYLNFPDESYT